MSIRLRLTLLYTVILALTLAVLGGILYGTQLQSIRREGEQMLASFAHRFVERLQAGGSEPAPPPPPPFPWREGMDERRFGDRLVYMQLLAPDGQVLARSEDLGEVILPLSTAGLRAVGRGESWLEIASVEEKRLLIYSAPIVVQDTITGAVQVARSIEEEDQYLGTLRRNLFVGSGLAVVIAFGAGWALSGMALRPIHRITQTA
ncbi:MAG TPA: hypothetical protein ENN99_14055 [Chloroflexi bacterium]|nr:hypothetical protein [Chloroflexota bacterium]